MAHLATSSLLIRQYESAHEEIAKVLDELRKELHTVVSVESKFLTVPGSLSALWETRIPLSTKESHDWFEILKNHSQCTMLSAPVTTLHNGQCGKIRFDVMTNAEVPVDLNFGIRTIMSADRKAIRLIVAEHDSDLNSPETLKTVKKFDLPDGGSVIIPVIANKSSDLSLRLIAEEKPQLAGQQPGSLNFVWITSKVITIEDESEALLGAP